MGRLDGKVCIITGGTSGIGAASVERFVAEGATVIFCGRRVPEGEAVAKACGGKPEFRQVDCTVEAAVAALIDHAVKKHGKLDVMFNNAGGPGPVCGIAEMPIDGYEQGVAVNLRTAVIGMKHAARVMKPRRRGSIINTASIAGIQAGYSSSMIYSAAKAGVIQLTKVVAMELGELGIRVNSISPGPIATGIFGKALGAERDKQEATAKVAELALAQVAPIKRAGLPVDVAHAAVFLASDESSYVNATDIVVDGGVLGGRQWTPQQQGLDAMRRAMGISH
jgi:NAD(P)-dependent dehydrogenase (short-subunit alcohol dehydrogenase family)